MWNNPAGLWNILLKTKCEIKFVPSYATGIFHICEANISYRRYFTRSVRNEFHWKKTLSFDKVFFLVGAGGFEPPKAVPTDLQSAPFGHSGTLPYLIYKKMELVDGLEPPTCWLQISCSTNWATPALNAWTI